MILDSRLEICHGTSVAATAGTALIGSQIDLAAYLPLSTDTASVYLGYGDPLYLHIITRTEIITGGSTGSILFRLCSDDSAAIHATTSTVHLTTPTYVTDDAAANSPQLNANGVIYSGPIPSGTYERYLGINCITASQDVTAGTVDIFITKEPIPTWVALPDGI